MIYLDSSAVVKLAKREAETPALFDFLRKNPEPIVISALVKTEAARALARSAPSALAILPGLLSTMNKKAITDDILDLAGRFADPNLRSLDAIHLATAEWLGSGLTAFIAYDKRLAEVARWRYLPVHVPS